jgi:hypothetical protein
LAKALDLDELDRFERWSFSGQDPKKFVWSSPDHAGTQPLGNASGTDVYRQALKAFKGKPPKSDIWNYGHTTGMPKVTRAEKWQTNDDGTSEFLGYVYVDEQGKEVDISGYHFVASHRQEADQITRDVFRTGSS